MEYKQTGERNVSLRSWSTRVPTRIAGGPGGSPFSVDGFISINGIPTSSKGRRKNKWEKAKQKRPNGRLIVKQVLIKYPLTILWCITLPLIGAIIQVLH